MSILKGEIVLHDLIQEMGLEIVRQRYWKTQSIMETWGCLSRFKKEQGGVCSAVYIHRHVPNQKSSTESQNFQNDE